MKRWKLQVNAELPSGNALLRYHWSKRKRVVDGWHWLLHAAGARKIPKATVRRRVHVMRYGYS